MLDKGKFAFIGAGVAGLGVAFTALQEFDWTVAVPAAFLPFVAPLFAFVKSEGLDKLNAYIASKQKPPLA